MQVYAASKLEARYIHEEVFRADRYAVTDLPRRPFVVGREAGPAVQPTPERPAYLVDARRAASPPA